MNNSMKDLYDYDLVENGYKCGIIPLNSKFHSSKTKNDGSNKCVENNNITKI